MKEKLHAMFSELSENELELLCKELKKQMTLTLEFAQSELNHRCTKKICASCNVGLQSGHYSLEFGPSDLRQRAHFCARDCLLFFVTKKGGEVEHEAFATQN